MKYVIFSLILLNQIQLLACDVCGCALGSMSMGVLPSSNSNFIGLRYSYASFNAQIRYNSQYFEDVYSNDDYHRTELFGRYYISQRWSITGILPVVANRMRGNTQNVNINGLGDPTLMTSYRIIQVNEASEWKHSMTTGVGLSLPLGRSDIMDDEDLINRNFQPGKGSVATVLNLNYLIRKKKVGLHTEFSYMINSRNRNEYRFGNQLNLSANAFYLWSKDKFALMPMLGGYFEQSNRHTDGSYLVFNTGGSAVYGSFGLQLYTGKFIFNANAMVPAIQNYHTDNITRITANARFSIGLRYNFSKNKN